MKDAVKSALLINRATNNIGKNSGSQTIAQRRKSVTVLASCPMALNAKAKVTTGKSYGFKSFKTLELALYHNLGALPQPIETHNFF